MDEFVKIRFDRLHQVCGRRFNGICLAIPKRTGDECSIDNCPLIEKKCSCVNREDDGK